MPDPVLILQAMGAAAAVAAVALLVFGWPWRAPCAARQRVGAVLGIGIGFFVGALILDVDPKWPPTASKDRLLFVLLPLVIIAELAAALPSVLKWLAWPLRLIVVAGAARILLHETVYLLPDAGPESWTLTETWTNFGGLALSLAVVWQLMALLGLQSRSRTVPLVIAMSCVGTALATMFTGYASPGGQMGLALGAAVTGAVAASFLLADPPDTTGLLGLGVVGLFALLVNGRFLGALPTSYAVLLFFGPLLCWLPEMPPRLRGVAKLAIAAVPVAVAVFLAYQQFTVNSTRTGSESDGQGGQASPGVTYEDYIKSLGK
jgi:hypothetical protein